MQTITTTELARNTRAVLDRVATLGETVQIERNRIAIAQIMPPQSTMTARQALSGLTTPTLTPTQAAEWLAESKDGFGNGIGGPRI